MILLNTETENLRVLKDKLNPDASACQIRKRISLETHRDTNAVFTRDRALPSGDLILLLIQQSNLNRAELSVRVYEKL